VFYNIKKDLVVSGIIRYLAETLKLKIMKKIKTNYRKYQSCRKKYMSMLDVFGHEISKGCLNYKK